MTLAVNYINLPDQDGSSHLDVYDFMKTDRIIEHIKMQVIFPWQQLNISRKYLGYKQEKKYLDYYWQKTARSYTWSCVNDTFEMVSKAPGSQGQYATRTGPSWVQTLNS